MSAGYVDARLCAAEGETSCFGLQALARAHRFGDRFARSATAFVGAGLVDFVGPFGGVRQNQHLVARNLEEAAADRHRFLGAALFDPHDTRQQGGQQRCVARQDAYDAFCAWGDDHIHRVVGVHFALRGYDLYS